MKYYIYLLLVLLTSCADQRPPSGGIKDMIAPKVIKESPKNFSTNFNQNNIEITFDEFIKFNPNGGNIIISPSIEKPIFKLIGKKIKISFKNKLEANTTYIVNFGNSIKDYTEGNKLSNYKYIFSTGSFIDSLTISGEILNAFNNKPMKDVIVGLYSKNNKDSILYKKPNYFIKSDNNGKYTLENIKKGDYYLAALEDKNLNYIYDQETEMIGFNNNLIIIDSNVVNKDIYMFNNNIESKLKNYSNEKNGELILTFTDAILDLELDVSTYNEKDIFYYTKNKKQLYYYYINSDTISSKLLITTNNNLRDTININLKNENKINITFLYESNIIKDERQLLLNFKLPIIFFNKDLFSLLNKNGKEIDYSFSFINNNKTIEILSKTNEDTLSIIARSNSFVSFNNKSSKYYSKNKIYFKENTSTLIIKNDKIDKTIIELYNNKEELINYYIVSRETIVFKNLKPGKYYIRKYTDINNNEIWDRGNIKTKNQAEKTLLYKEITIKENWENEIELK